MFPPTVSMPAIQRADKMGCPDGSSNSRRSMTSDAPRRFKKSASDTLPVAATTRKPIFANIATERLPTPPVAPVTTASPPGVAPASMR